MNRYKHTDESLRSAVEKCFSFRAVVRQLGLCLSGGTYGHIKRRIEKLGIDTSHFTGRASNRGKDHVGGNRKRLAHEVLVVRLDGLPEKSLLLRRSLVEIGREYVCEQCGLRPMWAGLELVLQVHHKDGNKGNNEERNLSFLCPNCHSQTDNFGYTGNVLLGKS